MEVFDCESSNIFVNTYSLSCPISLAAISQQNPSHYFRISLISFLAAHLDDSYPYFYMGSFSDSKIKGGN
jgi:hypothetical protein